MVWCPVLWSVLGMMNVGGFFLIRHDKKAASLQRRANRPDRVPERTFQLISLLGGWPGQFLAMQRYRHKTRKRSFRVVMLLAGVVGALGWLGWFSLFGCLDPAVLGL